jgi:hypothetical protein
MGIDVHKMTPAMAQRELAGRLAFEVMFGIIPVEAILSGHWLDRRMRDMGHTERLVRLWYKASESTLKYAWITRPL